MVEFFISAGAAGGDKPTVVMSVDEIPSEKPTVCPNKDIAKQQKAVRPTDKLKEGEENKFPKKPWLMPLQYMLLSVIDYLKITRLSSLVAIFAVEKVWL